MELSDTQLMLLEQLTYLDGNFKDETNIETKYSLAETVEELLKEIDTKELQKKNYKEIDGAKMECYEWAAIIDRIKNDKTLMELNINVKMRKDEKGKIDKNKIYAISFYNKKEPKKGIVAFKGTLDGNEWLDNFMGLSVTDTKCQKEALKYVNGLPFDDITVVGHSKGGNKAQYVTLLSDKVNKCVSMDGQGFSNYFIEKYFAEIQKKGKLITSYSLENDFVHMLMCAVPGSTQKYCVGNGVEKIEQNHSPNSYFKYIRSQFNPYDENRYYEHWDELDDMPAFIEFDINDEKREPKLEFTNESDTIKYLRGFVNFLMNVMPKEELEKVSPVLGTIAGVYLSADSIEYTDEETGKVTVYNKDNINELIEKKVDVIAKLVAYFIKYTNVYGFDGDIIKKALKDFDSFRLTGTAGKVAEAVKDIPKSEDLIDGIISFLKERYEIVEVADGDFELVKTEAAKQWKESNERNIYLAGPEQNLGFVIMDIIDNIFDRKAENAWNEVDEQLKKYGMSLDILFDKVENEYNNIPEFDSKKAKNSIECNEGRVYIFTAESYEAVEELLNGLYMTCDLEEWNNYRYELWYGELGIQQSKQKIEGCYSDYNDIIDSCKRGMEEVYTNEYAVHKKYRGSLKECVKKIKQVRKGYKEIADGLKS